MLRHFCGRGRVIGVEKVAWRVRADTERASERVRGDVGRCGEFRRYSEALSGDGVCVCEGTWMLFFVCGG